MYLEKAQKVNDIGKSDKVEIPKAPFHKVQTILYTWAIVFIAMAVYAAAWFMAGLIVMPFIDAITASFTFAEPWDSVVTFVRLCFLYHPVIAMIGWFIYGILQSISHGRTTYQY